ncbi:MAG TPA: electron transport complex subunit RsxC [Xanthomonadaceae bacterium]|nr:electron transport complex subunit RsxC [Xanthomonadaceae bacterium]
MRLHRFPGGLKLAGHKVHGAGPPIRSCPLPARLVVPMLQHAGAPARPCVEVGDRVALGQRIGEPEGERSVAVHAPAAGTVIALGPHRVAFGPGLEVEAVEIDVDLDGPRALLAPLDPQAEPAALLARLREAGLVGLGGAVFPTAEKLQVQRELLILNGAECEPYIACDDALLRVRAQEVVLGGLVLARIAGTPRVLLAVEDTMPEAIAAARAAIAANAVTGIELAVVPTVYPEGGERQLIRVLTGQEVPSRGLPRDLGIVVHNVGTAAAAWRAVAHGEPLVSRIVTVNGRGVAVPGNYEVAIGTPVAHLIARAGGYTGQAARLVIGGPMMGLALPHDGFAVTKSSNCVLVLAASDLRETGPELPCIRCGECSRVCPAQLMPQQLLAFIRGEDWTRTLQFGVYDCIECGCCDLACPSHIPLVEHFRFAKTELRASRLASERAEQARRRHEARAARLQGLRAERESRRARAAMPESVSAALQRARARLPRDTDEDTR